MQETLLTGADYFPLTAGVPCYAQGLASRGGVLAPPVAPPASDDAGELLEGDLEGLAVGVRSVPSRVAALFEKPSRLVVWLVQSRTSARSAGWRAALKGRAI
jgi:hypothetical protein